MPPITFRNVNAPGFSGTGEILKAAQGSFNAGADVFSDLVKRRQALRKQNFDRGLDEQETGFRNFLDSFDSAEGLAAAQESGAIDSRLAGFDAALQNRLRGADEERLGALRTQEAEAFDFQNAQRERADAPLLAEIARRENELRQSGDEQALTQGLEELRTFAANAGLSDAGLDRAVDSIDSTGTSVRGTIRDNNEFQRNESSRTRIANAREMMPKIIQGTGNERAALDVFSRTLVDQDVPSNERTALLQELRQTFAAEKGQTNAETQALTQNAALRRLELDRQIRNNPENNPLSMTDPQNVTEGDAMRLVRELVPSDAEDSVKDIRDATDAFKDEKGNDADPNTPWGALIQEAVTRVGPNEWIWPGSMVDSPDINKTDFKEELSKVYDDWIQFSANSRINTDLRKDFLRNTSPSARKRVNLPRPTQGE